MRSEIRKNLVKTFQREFEGQYPQFSLLKLNSGATKIWGWRCAPELHLFVVLHPFEKEDIFVLEIAWSEDGRFPWSSIGDEFALEEPCWRERLGRLWSPYGEEPVWDAAPEVREARQAYFDALLRDETIGHSQPPAVDIVIPRIGPLVADSLHRFRGYGLPVFEQVARHRGLVEVFERKE